MAEIREERTLFVDKKYRMRFSIHKQLFAAIRIRIELKTDILKGVGGLLSSNL